MRDTIYYLIIVIDEVVYLTSEKHDPYAQKVTYTKEENKNTLQKAPVWS